MNSCIAAFFTLFWKAPINQDKQSNATWLQKNVKSYDKQVFEKKSFISKLKLKFTEKKVLY